MMLRCTSPVPPPTVSAGANRKPWCHGSAGARRAGPPSVSIPAAPARSLARPKTRWPCSSASTLRIDASGPGASPRIGGADRAQPDEPQDLVLDVQVRPAAGGAPGRSTPPRARTRSTRSPAVGPMAPQRPARRQRDPLVAERDLGQAPAVALVADQVVGRQPHVVEEHLVERVRAGHLDDGPDVDAGQVHRAHEVGDALVLRRRRVGTSGDEDAVAGDAGRARSRSSARSRPTRRRPAPRGWTERRGRDPAPGSLKSWHHMSSPASSGMR